MTANSNQVGDTDPGPRAVCPHGIGLWNYCSKKGCWRNESDQVSGDYAEAELKPTQFIKEQD